MNIKLSYCLPYFFWTASWFGCLISHEICIHYCALIILSIVHGFMWLYNYIFDRVPWVTQGLFPECKWKKWVKLVRRNQSTTPQNTAWHPFHEQFYEQFFHRNSNLMDDSFCSHPSCSKMVAMKFCTWHDSLPCAKFCSNMIPYNGVTWNQFSIKFELQWKNRSLK